jgi:O-methyltransferase involved in polyketide biosynthesis
MSARDYSTISPSARALLAMRAQSDELPFARRAAELVFGADALAAEHARLQALPGGDRRLRHFVERYRSIDTLLAGVDAATIVEIGAGWSLRGFAMTRENNVVYVDSDLPAVIEGKRALVAELMAAPSGQRAEPRAGDLKLRALDALEPGAIRTMVDELPAGGPIAIVNEGLLMYLDDNEKQRLAASIREALVARGGVWITADIYIPLSALGISPASLPAIGQDERLKHFLASHNVEENKFASFGAAEQFFAAAGFAISRRLAADPVRQSWVLSPS